MLPEEPPPPPLPTESPRAAFLQRATPIITHERGLTPRARVLLSSLAKDMQLPDDDFREAMAILQRGELAAAKAVDPQRARFRSFLKRQLEELKAGILSARHEQTLLNFAISQLAMPEDAAREDLRSVAAEIGLRRVPLEEALRFVEEIVAQKIGDETMVDSNDLRRLYHLGRDWGLEPADVDDLVRYRLEDNAARGRRERLWNIGVIGGAIVAGALLLLVLVVLAARNWSGSGQPEQAVVDPEITTPDASEPRRTRPPAWWDTDLTIAISQLRNEQESFVPVYDALIAEDPQRRSQGYELLLDQASAAPFDARNWKLHEPVLIGCYALDPDDAAAGRLLQLWLAVVQRAVDIVPANPDEYQAAIRPISSAVRAIKDPRTPESRRQAMADELGRLVRAPLNASTADADLQRESLGGLSLVLLEKLSEEVAKRPEVLSQRHYSMLRSLGKERTAPEDMARLDAAVAAAAIDHAPDAWRSWEAILQRGIESRDSLAVLRIVDAYERTPSGDLRKLLETRLLDRVGVSPAGLPSNRYADAMRKALGASLPADTSDAGRWARLAPQAADALDASRRTANEPAAIVRATTELAWNVNLAMSLALPRPNPGQFDRWLAQGPPWEQESDDEESSPSFPAATGTSERLTREHQETFDRYLHDLGGWQELDVGRRASYLRGIAQSADKVGDIAPVQARRLASYLLGRKGAEEQTFVLDNATSLRWKQLRIALADGIERSQLPAEHLRRLVIIFSGREVLDIDENRAAARRVLLQSVVDELATARSGEAASDVDRWAGQLAAVYRQRAQLLGVAPAELESATSASSLLRLSVMRQAPPGTAEASDATTRLVNAADVLAGSDAQRCVLLQRAAVEGTAAEIRRSQPERRADARKLLDEYHRRNAAASEVLPQLKDGEATLLELWLLARLK